MDDWRVKVIFGAVAAVIVGSFVWNSMKPEDAPTPAEMRSSAEFVCQTWVEERVAPLDVDFRDPGSSSVSQDGDVFVVNDRAAVEGDLVLYECRTTRRENGDWKLEGIELR